MKARRILPTEPTATALVGQFLKGMLEPELEEIAGDWDAEKRRSCAVKLARWALQLDCSSALMQQNSAFAAAQAKRFSFKDPELRKTAKGLTPTQMLELAAKLERWVDEIREAVGTPASVSLYRPAKN